MAGGGYYPVMSDWEWDNAPWNEPEPRDCPYCDGEGIIDGVRCEKCDGEGVIYD